VTDTTTLPKWAQQYMCQYIHKLEQDVEYWKHAATAGPEESDTFIVQHGGASDTPLGTGVTVRFKLGNNDGDEAEVRNMGDGTIIVRTPLAAVSVQPRASNSLTIRATAR
jgi:hypothetical protein